MSKLGPAIALILAIQAFSDEQPVAAPLQIAADGTLQRQGVPYRGIGLNFFSAFVRTLHDNNDTSYDAGFRVLAEHEVPFVRFAACGFWPSDYALYRDDKERYFHLLDGIVESASNHGIGLIPSLFWAHFAIPDLVGEPVSAWGNANSKTRVFMRDYTREVVARYKASPAIWAWEFGNEYNLAADLPKAGKHFPPVVPQYGTPESRSDQDLLTSRMIQTAIEDFAQTVRGIDPQRPITAGHSLPRPAAWHLAHEESWKNDSEAQFQAMIVSQTVPPTNMASVHIYPFDSGTRWTGSSYDDLLRSVVAAARANHNAVFVGEFGAPDDSENLGPDLARRHLLEQIAAIERAGVDLAALWVFDLPAQEATINISAENKRRGLLKVVQQANQRLQTLARGTHAVELTSERWSGRLLDNEGNRGREGSGFNPLCSAFYPGQSLFRADAVGLNFEHIFNGMARDKDRSMFTPRNDPAALEVHSPAEVTVHWSAPESSWGMECRMRYTLSDDNAVDMEFRAIPREDHFGHGFAALMWASYMNHTRERQIHFYGSDDTHEGWVTFGEPTEDGFETGTVACSGVSNLPFDEGAQLLNLVEHPTKKFLEPFYYGLVDGDGDAATEHDTMAYIMMFDQREPIRFAMWNFIKDSDGVPDAHSPAWDWQYLIYNPEVGREYGYRARMMFVPFVDRESVRQSYVRWNDALKSTH